MIVQALFLIRVVFRSFRTRSTGLKFKIEIWRTIRAHNTLNTVEIRSFWRAVLKVRICCLGLVILIIPFILAVP